MAGDVSDEDFKRTLQFMTDYTFTHRPVVHRNEEVQVFRMPLWKRAFDIAASLGAIIALSPLLLAVAVAVKLDSRDRSSTARSAWAATTASSTS